LRHPAIQILPPCGMMSLKDLKEHHYTKQGGTHLKAGFTGGEIAMRRCHENEPATLLSQLSLPGNLRPSVFFLKKTLDTYYE
jgi:hypothetical protein